MSRYADLWPIVPDWVEYIVTDSDGRVVGWDESPEEYEYIWWLGFQAQCIEIRRTYTHTPDWRDSLERRPHPTNPTLCPHCGKEI